MPPLPQLGGIPATLELLHELGIGAIRRTKMTSSIHRAHGASARRPAAGTR
jgi:hypothetical protein